MKIGYLHWYAVRWELAGIFGEDVGMLAELAIDIKGRLHRRVAHRLIGEPIRRNHSVGAPAFCNRLLMRRMGGASTPDRFSWKHANAGAVTTDFKQCETDRILLGAEYATDETFLILRHPITTSVLGDLEMVRGRYRLRYEVRHVTMAYLLYRCSLRARQYIR